MIPRTSLVLGLATLVGCANNPSPQSMPDVDPGENALLETVPSSQPSLVTLAESDGEIPGFDQQDIDPELESTEAEINLEILADLDVFEVGDLILDVPAEAFSCYGWPCPEWAEEIAAARQEASVRLAAFTELAVYAVSDVNSPYVFPENWIGWHLDALRDLEVVEIGDLIEDEPEVTGNCYALPCPEEIAAADERNNERAWQLEAIVNSIRSL